jgi:multidrug efflux pump
MYLLGYSLDILSLMALTIATGFVVDDAIVVLENISRHIEAGMSRMQAALLGAREVGFTVLSISLSLVAVFTPILLLGGILGRLFREFTLTLSLAIMISLGISLTTTPMMCSRLLQHIPDEERGKAYRASERAFNSVLGAYERSLGWVLEHSGLTLTVLAITIGINIYLFWVIPFGFFPQQDNGLAFGGIQGPQDVSFQAMQKAVQRIVSVVKTDPAVDNAMAFTGGGGPTNGGFIFMGLKPFSQRHATSSQIIDRLRPKLLGITGANTFLQAGQDVRIGGRASSAQYQYTIQSDSVQNLVEWGPVLLQQMRKLKMLRDVNTDQQNSGLQARLTYDRATASRLGITPEMLDNSMYEAFGQAQVSTMYTAINQYHVVLEVEPQFWQSPVSLNDVYIRASQGKVVPLSAIAHYEPATAPLAVNHQGQYPSVTISFNLAPGISLSQAVAAITGMEQKIGLPSTVTGMFSGTLQAFKATVATLPFLLVTALAAVYIVLGILYESYVHPITILSTLPSAGVGAVLALMIFHKDLSLTAIIGVILLIGIVKKNAIMMIDFALAAERNEGKSPRDAIFQACILRFRPILMTTMAALFGALPLAFGTGPGSELRNPLGITIIGGLLLSQMLTLYTTPVVYLSLDRMRVRWLRAHGKLEGQHELPSFG